MTTKMATVSDLEYLFQDPTVENNLIFTKDGLTHLKNTSIYGRDATEVFNAFIGILKENGGNLSDCKRTWIYLRDIKDYQKMVTDRKNVFDSNSLTSYFASTGIHSDSVPGKMAVRLDAYSIIGLAPDRVMCLDDFNVLCKPTVYGVTFERGTRITYDDRYEYLISGTASVGKNGESLFPGNLEKQLDRTLSNVEKLLKVGGATMKDMRRVVVYLRNQDDFRTVGTEIAKLYPRLNFVLLRADICRPELLVEIEGRAVKNR